MFGCGCLADWLGWIGVGLGWGVVVLGRDGRGRKEGSCVGWGEVGLW